MNDKQLSNYFDNTMAFASMPGRPFYFLVMIGRNIPFKQHAIICYNYGIAVEEENRRDYEQLKQSHPDAWGTLDDARLESKETIVNALISKLGLERPIAETLVMGTDFWAGTTDLTEVEVSEIRKPLKVLPENPKLDGMAKRLFTSIRRTFADQTVLNALTANGHRDWPESAQEMLQLYKTAKMIDDNKTRKKQ